MRVKGPSTHFCLSRRIGRIATAAGRDGRAPARGARMRAVKSCSGCGIGARTRLEPV
ncbi:hypothetical protein Save01_06111 [Streptomyces avermitilis]